MKPITFSSVVISIVYFASLSVVVQKTYSHGSMETPVSRIYNCFLENPENPKSDACKAAVEVGGTQALYDWNGVNQGNADGVHTAIIPDGQLCSAGKDLFKGMDLARSDWPATAIAPDAGGRFEFLFAATAPHSTEYFKFYATVDGYNPLVPLRWSDIDEDPFCTINEVTLENGRYKMSCPLPQGKSGKHVIYTIWQRNDSKEAFYTCTDVEFINGSPIAWKSLGELRAQQDLTVGDSVRFRLFDANGSDVETISLKLQSGETGADQWPFYLAEYLNTKSAFARIGVLDSAGGVSPVQSSQNNNVYTFVDEELSFQIDIETGDTSPGGDITTDVHINDDWGSGYCADVTVTNNSQAASEWSSTFEIEGTVSELWSATYTQNNNEVTAQGVSWNNIIDSGQSTDFGFCAERSASDTTPSPIACSDNVDNDGDGLIDFPNDPGCESKSDDDESNEIAGGDIAVDVTINDDWGRGYCAVVNVTNNSSSAEDWQVSFPVEGKVRNMWSATYSQRGSTLVAEGVPWNNIVQPGSGRRFGFCAIR